MPYTWGSGARDLHWCFDLLVDQAGSVDVVHSR